MNSKDSFLQVILSDEESMHAIWFLTYMLLSWQMKFFVDGMFFIWAYINTCEWFDYLNVKHPNFPIVGLFS